MGAAPWYRAWGLLLVFRRGRSVRGPRGKPFHRHAGRSRPIGEEGARFLGSARVSDVTDLITRGQRGGGWERRSDSILRSPRAGRQSREDRGA
jgi:hypothetical protein